MEYLSENDAIALYQNRIYGDFMPDEVKPVSRVRELFESGRYSCHALSDQSGVFAYGYVFEGSGSTLLDYYAVRHDRRGGGVGSSFLPQIVRCSARFPFLIEAEDPDFLDGEHRENAERRLGFYGRLGAKSSRVRVKLFGVRYVILYYKNDGGDMDDISLATTLSDMYDELLGDVRGEAQISLT